MPRTKRRMSSDERGTDPLGIKAKPLAPSEEVIGEDDICSICNLLYWNPCLTKCGHMFCEPCFSHWADVSLHVDTIPLRHDINEEIILTPADIEAKCPMCRTSTTASLDDSKATELNERYPATYASRSQEASIEQEDEDGNFIETLSIYIGNEHRRHRREPDDDPNAQSWHDWRFFLKFSRHQIVEEVRVWLHPTFRQNHVILSHPPFALSRRGWGTFEIIAHVVLKGGYQWLSADAEDSFDGAPKGSLPLTWTLDFQGAGSQGRLRLKVLKQKQAQEIEDERQFEQTRRLWQRQRERDPDYVPMDED